MSDEDRMRKVMDRAKLQDQSISEDWESFRNRAHRRLFMNRALISGVAVLFFAAGITAGAFILRDDAPKSQNILPVGTDEPTAEPEPTEEPPVMRDVLVELWYSDGQFLTRDLQTIQVDDLAETPTGLVLHAIEALLDPTRTPSELSSAIPPDVFDSESSASDVSLSGMIVGIENRIATIGLPAGFESGGGSLSMMTRVGQVVFTATQFEGVDGVLFMIDGEPRDSIGGEGIDTSHPLTRADFDEDIQPPITVEYPKPGAAVTSPVMISGTADVFEANVNIRILDENGEVLAETFVTATCGTGCRGTYEKNVKFTIDHEQEGIIEVLTYSMEDGSPMWSVQTPVTLFP